MLDCIITVHGQETLTPKPPYVDPQNGKLYSNYNHRSTVRPVRDQKRPVRDFIKAASAYGSAIRAHIVGCRKCKPNDLLTLFEQRDPPATMRPSKLLKSLFRTDKRTDRIRCAKMIGRLDSRDLVWLAKFGSEKELWAGTQGVRTPIGWTWIAKEGPVSECPEPERAWKIQVQKPDGSYGDHPEGHRRWTARVQYEDLIPESLTKKREMLQVARTLLAAGGSIPATLEEARRQIPVAVVLNS